MRLAPLLWTAVLAAAQTHPLQEAVNAARTNNTAALAEVFAGGLPEMKGRDGALVWGQEFLFAVESATPATVAIDKQPPVSIKPLPGTPYFYLLKTLRMGATHSYHYFDGAGQPLGGYEVAAYNPYSYPLPGVARGKLSEKRRLRSSIYPGVRANYWVYANAGLDMVNGTPLTVWQDGETIAGNVDLLRLRLQIVTDNMVARGAIPPMVDVLIQPGQGGTKMRSIQYDTVSGTYGEYLRQVSA